MKVVLSIDVEAHRTLREIDGGENSLGKILDALLKHEVKATFFVDMCEVETWGFNYMKALCTRIQQGGHEVALHVHPHHFTKDRKRWLLSEYSEQEQRRILRYAIDQYRRAVGSPPVGFRAGGFGINDTTLKILAEEGLQYDSSFLRWWQGSELSAASQGHGECFRIGGITEVPPTIVVTLRILGRRLRSGALDFNWLPLFFLKRVLDRLRRDDSRVAVLLLHSSSMMRRVTATAFAYKEGNYSKFCSLLYYLKQKHEPVPLAECGELWSGGASSRGGIYVEPNVLVQYVLLLYQSCVGRGHSRRFFLFWWGHVATAVSLCAIFFSWWASIKL